MTDENKRITIQSILNSEPTSNQPIYISKKERLNQLMKDEDFKKAFNLTHGKGTRKKKKRRKNK